MERISGFNTQPRGGGCFLLMEINKPCERFNTQPRGGGCLLIFPKNHQLYSFNTQPRGGGCRFPSTPQTLPTMFQHTAARRRLRD